MRTPNSSLIFLIGYRRTGKRTVAQMLALQFRLFTGKEAPLDLLRSIVKRSPCRRREKDDCGGEFESRNPVR